MNGPLDGLVALITGGASGLGAAIARRMKEDGASVAVFDLNESTSQHVDLGVIVDVGDDSDVQAGIFRVASELGGIDILINNAGVGTQGTVAANRDDEWHRVWDVNVVSIARVTRAALPYLRDSENAVIVNTASIAATTGLPDRALYSATKGAVVALTRALAADHLREGIRVNAVNPGTADTPWVNRLLEATDDPESERRALEARQPHGRLVTAEEVADAVAYLVNPRARSTTGVMLPVDGGMHSLSLRPR